MSVFSILKQGQIYLKTWPLEARLGIIFPENRVIKVTQFAQKFMPFMAVLAILWQQFYAKSDIVAFAAAVLIAVFALCIPLQGLYWLGKRANTVLPAQSTIWFYYILEKLQQINISVPMRAEKPTYQDLAELLLKAKMHLEVDFWQEI